MPAELVLAVVGLAGQLLDGFVKLNDFCQRVNEAPEDLLGLEADHANLTMAVDNCAEQRKKDKLEHDDSFTKSALQVCEDELRTLADLTASLKPEPGARWWKRKQKAIKTVFKDRTIENCKGRLEAARSTLILARIERVGEHQKHTDKTLGQVLHLVEDINRNMSTRDQTVLLHVVNLELATKQIEGRLSGLPSTDLIATSLEGDLQTQSTAVMPGKVGDYVYEPTTRLKRSQPPARQPYSRALWKRTTVQRHTESYLALLANICCHYEHVQIDLGGGGDEGDTSPWNVRNDYKSTFQVVPNWWPLKTGVSVSMLRTGQGWLPQVQFAFFNVRSYEAPIFEACSRGDVKGVKKLLSGGEASPFDQDPDGWTPLHCAAQAHRFELCKLLISQGANPDCIDSQRVSPLHLALSQRPHIHPLEAGDDAREVDDVPELVRLLVEFGGSDPSLENDDGYNCYDLISSHAYRWPVAVQIWLFRQTVFDFDPNHRDPQGLMTFMKVKFLLAAAPADLDALFDSVEDINATVELADDHSHPYEVGWTILHIAMVHLLQGVACPVDAAARRDRVRYLLQRGADPHALSGRGETPTDIALRHVTLRKFNAWRDILCETGYNLREFVKAEIAVHSCVRWYAMNWCDYYLISLLELDDEPEDELMNINTSGLFRSRDDMPLNGYEGIEVDEDLFAFLDDSDDDRPRLSISEKRRKRRAYNKSWRLSTRPQHQPGIPLLSNSRWNVQHERADWILYGKG